MQEDLPIFSVIPDVLAALAKDTTLILQAPPGAGKSTVLPIHLLLAPWMNAKKILMLEPRRLAAKAVAWRLAESFGEDPGNTVGYRIRFETRVGKRTRIEVVTEGILTRILQHDNTLDEYGLVIFDEFHERSLHADLSLALCREAQQILRPDLRLLIMSATLDGAEISAALNHAPVISSEGRQYPITYRYLEPDATGPIARQVVTAIRIALREETGDVLVFLPGSGDIRRAVELLESSEIPATIHALYGDLPHDQQQQALLPDPAGRRKIILSTSIAETSLTIEGIRIVIDSGYARVPKFDLRSGMTRLETTRVTRDTADQRAGRAGRTGPGVCYRLWPERTLHQLVERRRPEILEADLAPLLLELANWGHTNPDHLSWITPPPAAAITQARQLLEKLEALEDGKITRQGRRLLEFPTHPRLAHLLLYGQEHGLSCLAADVAALLEERDPFLKEAGADIHLRVETLNKWRKKERVDADRNGLNRIDLVSKHWCSLLQIARSDTSDNHDDPGRLVAAAYPERIARREGERGRYRLANGRAARLAEYDPLNHSEWIAVAQVDGGTGEGKIFLAASFDPAEIIARSKGEDVIDWDSRNGIIHARREWKIGNLVVMQKPLSNPDPEAVGKILCEVIQKEGLQLFDWTDKARQLCARVMSLKKWTGDESLPDLHDAALLHSVSQWAGPFIQNVRKKEDFKKLDLVPMISSKLNWEQQRTLEEMAPEKIPVPSGSQVSLAYSEDGSAPVLAVRLQEVFGWGDTPTVNRGRVKILMHLLSPGYRPVQVTQDLRSFWDKTYPEVRKELRIRYQKHSWPEDPWTAEAVRGAKKRNR